MALATIMIVPVTVLATPTVKATWHSTYPSSASLTNADCLLCHGRNTSEWNAYGLAIANAGSTAAGMKSLESADSDGNGTSNIDEINAGTQPGWKAGSTNTVYDIDGTVFATNVPMPAAITGSADPTVVDTTPPSVPKVSVRFNTSQLAVSGTVPVRVAWSATDASGIGKYTVQRATGATGAFAGVTLASATATSVTQQLTPGTLFRYRAQAADAVGNVSAFSAIVGRTVAVVQEGGAGIVYGGAWSAGTLAGASAGSVKFSAVAGRTVKFTFSGSNIGWVAQTGTNRGKATVQIDALAPVTIDLYSATVLPRKIVFQKTGLLATGTHSILIKVLGTKNAASTAARVDIDAFVTMK